MSTSPDHSTAQTEWDRAEGARFRSTAATTGLVALITLRELARRRGALALATLLPLTFYLVRLETHWTAIRLPVDRPGAGRRRRWRCSHRSRPAQWTAASP